MNKKMMFLAILIASLIFSIVGCKEDKGLLIDLEMKLIDVDTCIKDDGIVESKTRNNNNIELIKTRLTTSQMNLLGLNNKARIYTNFYIDTPLVNETLSNDSFGNTSPYDLKDMNDAINKIDYIVNKEKWILIPDDILYQHKGIKYVVHIGPRTFYFYDDDGDGKVDRIEDQYGNSYTWEEYMDYFISYKNGGN